MAKQAISVTLDVDNITWLKARSGAAGVRSVSELLDRLVTEARQTKRIGPSRSVVGTIDIDASDPLLVKADATVRALLETAVGRPILLHEGRAKYRIRTKTKRRRG